LRVTLEHDATRTDRSRGLQAGDGGAVLRDVVRRHADGLADGRDHTGWEDGSVRDEGADGRGTRVAPRPAVERDGERRRGGAHRARRVVREIEERHATRMHPQLSHDSIDPEGARLMRSASVEGIVRWHPWHVVPTSRAMPTPCAFARRCSYAASR